MSPVLLVFFTGLVGVVSWFIWDWMFWRRRGVGGPIGFPVVGSSLTLLDHFNPPPLTLQKWTKEYGKLYGYNEGVRHVLVVSEPAVVQDLFVNQFDNFYGRVNNPLAEDPETASRINLFSAQGNRWKRLRAISSPSFSNNSLKKLKDTVEDTALELMRYIEPHANGEPINFLTYYQEYTMDVIGRVAMGQTRTEMFKNPLVKVMLGVFSNDRWLMTALASAVPKIVPIFRLLVFTFPAFGGNPIVQLINTCQAAVSDRVKQREQDALKGIEPQEPADFIDLFLDARADVQLDSKEAFSRETTNVSKQLTLDEVVGQCMIFLIAGFDTTALSLSYTTYLLATHPEIMKKVQREIDEHCPNPSVTFDELTRLNYMDCVVRETLRLYPLAAIANSRKCMRPTTLGGVHVEEDTLVMVDTWSLHNDKSVWGEDASEFRPERWLDPEQKKNNGWIPFGHGPRQCVGMRLAMMEEKILLVHILRKYDFCVGPKTEMPLKLVGRATTGPEAVHIYVKTR